MLKLRRWNAAPPGGFALIDKATNFKAHGWSINAAASLWFHEQHRRGNYVTMDSCKDDVEKYTCEELMKSPGWQEWVTVAKDHVPFVPNSLFQQGDTSVSVVIPHKMDTERLLKCISSVLEQANEIIAVTDHTKDPLKSHRSSKVRFLPVPEENEAGFGTKCNLGAREATGAFVWFLNDDCYPLPGCKEHLINVLLANPKIGAVGHLLRYPNGFIQHGGTERVEGRVGFPHRDSGKLHPSLKVPTEMEAVTAASMMVRREAFDAVGGFDEGYFLYLEDTDLCLAMRQKGWKVYFTPFAEAVHEESASSSKRPDNSRIIVNSSQRFTEKWKHYYAENPKTPTFEAFEQVSQTLTIDAVYVHLVGSKTDEARKFVDSVAKHPPGHHINWIIACNNPERELPSDSVKGLFSRLGNVTYFSHDNSGWDIGAFQAYAKVCKSDLCLFFGSSAYCRQNNWAQRMLMAYRIHGPNAIYGVTGNMGNQACNVAPHLRTTGFWCKPEILRQYPTTITKPEERYPFEHGPQCMTMWAWSQGYQVYVVETQHVFAFPDWDNGPQGFHRGEQRDVIFGDRVCAPPYHPHP